MQNAKFFVFVHKYIEKMKVKIMIKFAKFFQN